MVLENVETYLRPPTSEDRGILSLISLLVSMEGKNTINIPLNEIETQNPVYYSPQ